MTRKLASFTVALLACAGARAATINTTLTVTATGTIGITTASFTGTASLSGGIGSGTISADLDLAKFTAPFTITLTSGTTGTITGTITVPLTIVTTGTGAATATITGGTGTYAGATGSFPSLTGTGGIGATGAITLTFSGAGTIVTGGGGPAGPPAPSITAVLDSASNTSNVAQGGIFIVKGSTLCPSGVKVFGVPRPAVSPDGVKITFTPAAGGAGTDSLLVYTFNPSGVCQLAAILPSTVAPGNYNVTVTNGSASAPFATKVVQSKFALFTQDSSGSGLASVQNAISQTVVDLNSFTTGIGKGTTISPAHPGQFVIAYGTGMGPLVGGDNSASPAFDFSANGVNVKAIVGGVTIPVAYAGRAGFAGEDQINVQLPATVPTGCVVSFQISVNGTLSNVTFIAIAPDANASACVQPGFTTAQLQQFDSGVSRTIGSFSLSQFSIDAPPLGTIKSGLAGGGFVKYTGFQLAALAQYQAQVTSSGSCYVIHAVSSSSSQTVPTGTIAGLDAGVVTLNGPSGSGLTNQAFAQDLDSLSYSLNLGTEGIPIPGGLNAKLVAGQYTVAGAGGKDVGKFSTSLTLGSPLNLIAPLPNTVTESAGLTLNWTGGNASDLVEIAGSSSTITGTGINLSSDSWTFICTTTAGAGTFTVPASVLTLLPKAATASTTGGGFLEFASVVNPSTFTAPLTAGGSIDAGTFLSLIGFGGSVSYQ